MCQQLWELPYPSYSILFSATVQGSSFSQIFFRLEPRGFTSKVTSTHRSSFPCWSNPVFHFILNGWSGFQTRRVSFFFYDCFWLMVIRYGWWQPAPNPWWMIPHRKIKIFKRAELYKFFRMFKLIALIREIPDTSSRPPHPKRKWPPPKKTKQIWGRSKK